MKEKAKEVGLTHSDIAELLGIHRVTVSKKLAGETIYAGDVEFVVSAWSLLSPKRKEQLKEKLRQMRTAQQQPPPEDGGEQTEE